MYILNKTILRTLVYYLVIFVVWASASFIIFALIRDVLESVAIATIVLLLTQTRIVQNAFDTEDILMNAKKVPEKIFINRYIKMAIACFVVVFFSAFVGLIVFEMLGGDYCNKDSKIYSAKDCALDLSKKQIFDDSETWGD